MPKDTRHQTMERHPELLEVWGFDLLAHVEAMLRHARQYNQEVKQLRSHLGKGQTDTEQVSLDAVLQRGRQHCSVKLFARWQAEASERRISV